MKTRPPTHGALPLGSYCSHSGLEGESACKCSFALRLVAKPGKKKDTDQCRGFNTRKSHPRAAEMDTDLTFEIQGIIYLIREIFGMRGSESDPHVRIDAWNMVQQVREAQTAQFRPVDGFKAPAELGQLSSTKLLLWRISVAVYILTQQSYLLHPLNQIHQTIHHERWPSDLLEVYTALTVGGFQ